MGGCRSCDNPTPKSPTSPFLFASPAVNGVYFPNPFVIGSGESGNTRRVGFAWPGPVPCTLQRSPAELLRCPSPPPLQVPLAPTVSMGAYDGRPGVCRSRAEAGIDRAGNPSPKPLLSWGSEAHQNLPYSRFYPADQVMKKAFDDGWGGVICKTLSLDSTKVGMHDAFLKALLFLNCQFNCNQRFSFLVNAGCERDSSLCQAARLSGQGLRVSFDSSVYRVWALAVCPMQIGNPSWA